MPIRSGLAAVARNSSAMELYFTYNGSVYGIPWASSEGWGGTHTLIGAGASTCAGMTASMRTPNDPDVLWIGPDKSVVGTNINEQRGDTRFDALPPDNPSFQKYAASTGLPSDV